MQEATSVATPSLSITPAPAPAPVTPAAPMGPAAPAAPTVDHLGRPVIVRHSKRPRWGLAVRTWEREGKCGYVFEDGSERVFKIEYCGMFEPSEAHVDVAQRLWAATKAASAEAEKKMDPLLARRKKAKAEMPTFEEQVVMFYKVFPDGFADAAYRKKHRGGTGRRVSRHRDPAIAEAKTLLAKEALDELLAAGRHDDVLSRAVEILGKTDFVTKRQLAPLREAKVTPVLAQALRDALHEPDPQGKYFDELLRTLGRASKGRIGWPLVTALRALVNPDDDVCVRPTVFLRQAVTLSPTLAKKTTPRGMIYNRWLAMVEELRARLAGSGLDAHDNHDVYEFIWLTLRPAAKKLLDEVRAEAVTVTESESAAAPEDVAATAVPEDAAATETPVAPTPVEAA